MPTLITKEAFLSGAQCLTQGWRLLREEGASLTPALEWRFHVGAEVGRLAQLQLGKGRALLRTPVDKAASETQSALSDPASTLLFEATFLADPFVARADALRRTGNGWDLIEVKSGKLPAEGEKLNEDYLSDLAYTAFVARHVGLPIHRYILMLINPEYRLGASAPLMVELDVTEEVQPGIDACLSLAPTIARALLDQTEPAAELKYACRKCDYFEVSCVGQGITDPLFDIPRLQEKKFDLLKPYGRVSAIPPSVKLTDNQERVARVVRSGQAEVDHAALGTLATVQWPACYLDFEGVAPALPWFEDAEPYRQIPFQYSLHRCYAPGQVADHQEYLALNTGDWRADLCDRLLTQLGERGSIVVYSGYEKQMLNYLARALPAFAPRIEAVIARLFDLLPVVRDGYCHPGFHGGSGIKSVLPVMVPELGYSSLTVQDGTDAAGVFALMRVGKKDGSATSVHRQDLLEYCKLDTLAMVRVHEALTRL
jgi:hypothetical protein